MPAYENLLGKMRSVSCGYCYHGNRGDQKGRGVCGAAWESSATIIVPDVELFPGHIACSSLSRSEIVIPIIKSNIVVGVLDVDSEFVSHFDETDGAYLEEVCKMLAAFV